MSAPSHRVTIEMSSETVQALSASGCSLYAFMAVECSDHAALPVVWLKTGLYSAVTSLSFATLPWMGYTARPHAPGTPVLAGFSAAMQAGETLSVAHPSGIGTLATAGIADAATLANTTDEPLLCGLAQPADQGCAPVCVAPLYGHHAQILTPLPKVLLLFSSTDVPVGTPVCGTARPAGPGVLIHLDEGTDRSVTFDLNRAWNWGEATWARAVGPLADLVPLLVAPPARPTAAPRLAGSSARLAAA